MTLTEQWKKGELPRGWYWVEGSRAEGIYAYTAEYLNNMYRPRNSERIIEQVPSYQEWKTVFNYATKYEVEYVKCVNDYEELKNKNQQLKDVISKMCMELVDPDDGMSNGLAEYFNQDLLLEINEVLK